MRRLLPYILIMAVTFSGLQFTAVSANSLGSLQKKQEELKKSKENTKKALEETKKQQKSIAEEIETLDREVAAAREELDKVETELAETEAELAEAEKVLAETEEKNDRQYELLKKRLRFIQENGTTGYVAILLESESFNDFLQKMQYVNDIMEYDEEIIKELKENIKLINIKKDIIETNIGKIEVLLEQQIAKANEWESKRSQKQATYAKYRQDEAKYEEELAATEKASKEVESLIAAAQVTYSSGNVRYTGGKLQWPVPSRFYISSGYGNRKRPIGSGYEFHTGIDIPAGYGANIVAGEAGTVITARYVNGYGYTVIIDHGGGLTTLYGHNSKLSVSAGQKVTRGQTIAKAGSTGNSTGNHCHFEVRSGGKHVNPKNYLGS